MKLFPLTVSTCHHSGLDGDWLCSLVTIWWSQRQTRYPGSMWSHSQSITLTIVPSSPNLCYSEAHSYLEGELQGRKNLSSFPHGRKDPNHLSETMELWYAHPTNILISKDWSCLAGKEENLWNVVVAFNFQRFSSWFRIDHTSLG